MPWKRRVPFPFSSHDPLFVPLPPPLGSCPPDGIPCLWKGIVQIYIYWVRRIPSLLEVKALSTQIPNFHYCFFIVPILKVPLFYLKVTDLLSLNGNIRRWSVPISRSVLCFLDWGMQCIRKQVGGSIDKRASKTFDPIQSKRERNT